jgi:hypothetical protein
VSDIENFIFSSNAGMAELADAQASGACGSNIVRVQVPLPAFYFAPICAINTVYRGIFMYLLIRYRVKIGQLKAPAEAGAFL